MTAICPCSEIAHPLILHNPPALPEVAYRVGDFRSFRHALLQPLSGEVALRRWRPTPSGDFALQFVEWCAYIADVLAFYNERSLNSNLLGTASRDVDVRGLVRILGYRPRPGIGGSAVVGALLGSARSVSLSPGFQLQSKPDQGKQPQTFETTDSFSLSAPDAVPAAPPGSLAGPASQLYLDGTIKLIHPGDLLLCAPSDSFSGTVLINVQSIDHRTDSEGRAFTEVVPTGSPTLPQADAVGYRLLRSGRSSGLWKYQTVVDRVASPLEMEGVDRSVAAGQELVMTAPGTALGSVVLDITGTVEEVWYTNGDATTPPPTPTPPAGSPHTRVFWDSSFAIDTTAWNDQFQAVRLLVDWRPVGVLRNAPVVSYAGTPMTLIAAGGNVFKVGSQEDVLIEDANGVGVLATASVDAATPATLTIASFATNPPPALKTPLRVLQNVIQLSRGKSVDAEYLGTGDAAHPFQEFILQKSPLTYLPAGNAYKSTLSIYVNGVQWTEVSTFYAQAADAQVFTTLEDDQQKTHVKFGDGVNGALAPTGASIVAYYRIESGLNAPQSGALITILNPVPGVQSVRYPVVGGGGADPDAADKIREYAPRSVLTFGRAISADDYEAVAATAPSVTRVRAYYAWSAAEQRATVTLYVGDTPAAVTSAKNALLTSADPNRPVSVLQATAVALKMFVAIRITPGRVVDDVVEGMRTALADPDSGLLGASRTGIGESIYFSQISDACQHIPGVEAVTAVFLLLARPAPQSGSLVALPPRINVSDGEFLVLARDSVFIDAEVLTGA